MLYRTHPHSIFTLFNHFPHLLLSHSPRIQAMESVPENKPAAFEEDIFVDELLDFSNEFSETEEYAPPQPEVNQNEAKSACPVFSDEKFDFGPLPEPELNAPEEGLESLEWLSHFTEDSFPDCTLTGKLPTENRAKPAVPSHPSCFESPVHTKARTKRARTGVRVWPVLSPSFTESSTSSSSSSTSSTTSFSPNSLWPFTSQTGESFLGKPLHKKQKKKPASAGGMAAPTRRCSHCGVTKTPQWRAGPHGSKTLCNACGVRFKSGRLLPEYRPACSPTFSTDLHSNNHRKVLEMRRQKDTKVEETGLPLPPPVQCFLKSY